MTTTYYTCPTCGHVMRNNTAQLALHAVVSHSGNTPIYAIDATGMEG
jgi:hypothetical protein